MNRQELAHNLFKQGYNCAQSVIMAFEDVLPLDGETLGKISSAFGGGFAKTRNICGAVSAIGMIVGLLEEQKKDADGNKADIYKKVREITNQFEKLNSSLICGTLLKDIDHITKDYIPTPRTKEYYEIRPCVKFVMDAVSLIEETYNLN